MKNLIKITNAFNCLLESKRKKAFIDKIKGEEQDIDITLFPSKTEEHFGNVKIDVQEAILDSNPDLRLLFDKLKDQIDVSKIRVLVATGTEADFNFIAEFSKVDKTDVVILMASR